ncbi:acyl-CoA dehydrogenase family protein [Nocardioides sp. Bht2]|uniref:acyl-CoA dehydrogenase family protein n=1 Tax=Nocardioides sp. Bht2 TaxID=3392297 RepID=UPI0039B470D3
MNRSASSLATIIETVVAPAAGAVDKEGAFPRASIDALAAAGLFALTVPTQYGGAGLGPQAAVDLVREIAGVCGSTAMVTGMHYAATGVLIADDRAEVLEAIGRGEHLTTLAFSETGSRSHFWAPGSTATAVGDRIRLDAHKSWVTSAQQADSYIWSSRPLAAEGPMTLWFVPTSAEGLEIGPEFDGLGLRGNGSTSVRGNAVEVEPTALIGTDGEGLDFALASALPWFLLVNAAASAGLIQAVIRDAVAHVTTSRLEHLGQTLAQQPQTLARIATMQITADRTNALLDLAAGRVAAGAEDAPLRVLEAKACADEASAQVADLAMQVCGGAAFRKELSIERRFRDSRAARVMAPTQDALAEFIGRAVCGMGELIDEAALVALLASGQLAGAALDTTEQEPLPADSALWATPGVVITPHVSWFSDSYTRDVVALFAANIEALEEGRPLANVVDRELGFHPLPD